MWIDDFYINPKQIARISEPIISGPIKAGNYKGKYMAEIHILFSSGAVHSIIQRYDSNDKAKNESYKIVNDLISKIEQ